MRLLAVWWISDIYLIRQTASGVMGRYGVLLDVNGSENVTYHGRLACADGARGGANAVLEIYPRNAHGRDARDTIVACGFVAGIVIQTAIEAAPKNPYTRGCQPIQGATK